MTPRKRAPKKFTPVTLPSPVRHEDGRITLFLTLPHKSLSPNHRALGRFAILCRAEQIRLHRNRAKLRVLEALAGKPAPAFRGYTLAFFHEVIRKRDDDNAAASCKAYRDGIADGLKIDDNGLWLSAPPTFAIDADLPRVEITLHP